MDNLFLTSRRHWWEQVNSTVIEFHLSETSRSRRARTRIARLLDRDANCVLEIAFKLQQLLVRNMMYPWQARRRLLVLQVKGRDLNVALDNFVTYSYKSAKRGTAVNPTMPRANIFSATSTYFFLCPRWPVNYGQGSLTCSASGAQMSSPQSFACHDSPREIKKTWTPLNKIPCELLVLLTVKHDGCLES